MDRRAFLGALGLLPAPLAAAAQEPGKVYRIGFLRSGHPPESYIAGVQQGLREQGYVPGQNVVLELRATDGSADQLPGLAEELVRSRVDVVVASAGLAALAVMELTRFRGHPIVGAERSVHDAEESATVPGGVQAAHR